MTRTPHLPLTRRAARRLAPAVALAVAMLALAPAPARGARAPALRIGDARVSESEAAAVFTIKVRGKRRGPVTVRYATADRTATAGEDYAPASGRLRFGPRQKVRRVEVSILDDQIDEPDETFVLRLSKAKGGRLADRVGVATILDDDPTVAGPLGALVINEVDYDQVGADDAEFVEVRNGATQPVSLDGLELHLVNGSTLATYGILDLSGPGTLAPGGYLVAAMPDVAVPPGTPTIDMPEGMAIQNGPDGLALTLRAGETCTLIDALSYEGSLNGVVLEGCLGVHDLVEGTPTTASDSNADFGSLARLPDGSDTDDAATDWGFTATITPGAANAAS